MEIRKSVFGSKSERNLYNTLESTWAERFDIYPSMPFANIIDITDARITQRERDFLFKTSVDFTLCEKDLGKPVMSIDFDGIGSGFSHEHEYMEPRVRVVRSSKDPNRKLKFDLKLRIAQEVGYPYVIVAWEEAEQFSEDLELTIVDGIVGNFVTAKRFEELAKERNGELTQEGFEEWKERQPIKYAQYFRKMEDGTVELAKTELTFDHYVLAKSVELQVEAEFDSSPVSRMAINLFGTAMRKGFMMTNFDLSPVLLEFKSPLPEIDSETLEAIRKRKNELENGSVIGHQMTFKAKDSPKQFTSRVFVRNFGPGSYRLAEEIATILAAKKALVWWLSEGKEGTSE